MNGRRGKAVRKGKEVIFLRTLHQSPVLDFINCKIASLKTIACPNLSHPTSLNSDFC